jgi:hypothetical protein
VVPVEAGLDVPPAPPACDELLALEDLLPPEPALAELLATLLLLPPPPEDPPEALEATLELAPPFPPVPPLFFSDSLQPIRPATRKRLVPRRMDIDLPFEFRMLSFSCRRKQKPFTKG